MLQRLDLRGVPGTPGRERQSGFRNWLKSNRSGLDTASVDVAGLIADVRTRGDAALVEATKKYDGVQLSSIRVSSVDTDEALRNLDPLVREALEELAESALSFHRNSRPENFVFDREGLDVRTVWRPVDTAGCYIPGGRAIYPSSVIMTAIPARVAGVERVVMCVPPGPDGVVPSAVLAAASIAQVDEVYAIGGAQAIAAMAYGTETVTAVDVIAGAGNKFVTAAKREVASDVGVPVLCSGPSEVVVIADETTPPELVAIDMLAQAEHGPDGLSWLITWSDALADAVEASVTTLSARAMRRDEIELALNSGGRTVLVDDAQAALDLVNAIAPEQVEVATIDPEALIPHISNAGSILAGVNCPAVVADYMSGPSHILPVGGAARFSSSLGVTDFMRQQHIVSINESALGRVGPHVAAIAEIEGLEAHAKSVQMRTQP